jgi:hypothetical protein
MDETPAVPSEAESAPPGTLIAVDPTGRRALLQAGETLWVADLATGLVQSFDAPGAVLSRVPWTQDGEHFALRLNDEMPALVSLASGRYTSPELMVQLIGRPAPVSPPTVARLAPRAVFGRGRRLEALQLTGDVPDRLQLGPLLLPPGATPVIDPTGKLVAFRDQERSLLVVVELDTGHRTEWPESRPQQQFDLLWAPDGQRFLCAGTLVDLAAGRADLFLRDAPDVSDAPIFESLDWISPTELLILRSRTVLREGNLLREQQLARLSRTDGMSVILKHTEPADPIRPTGFSAVRLIPEQSACLLSHHTLPDLFRLSLAGGQPIPLPLTMQPPRPLLPTEEEEEEFGPRSFGTPALVAQRHRELADFTAYIHQLHDTPDWFNGDWACGPTTCVMLAANFGRLPRWSLPIQNGTRSNDYSAYIPGLWEGASQRFTIQQKDPDGNLACGAYGYICPPGTSFVAADWGRMEQFLRLLGLQLQPNLANVAGLDWDTVWNRLVEQIDQNHACLLSITLKHPNGRTIEHIFLAYGYVEYTTGQRALIAKDPYGNWTGAGFDGQGGNGVHYWLNRSAQGAPSSGLVRVKFIRGVWSDQPRTPGLVLDDAGNDFARFGPADHWHFESRQGYGSPGRLLPLGPGATGLWWASTAAFGPWQTWATWRFQLSQPGRYRLHAFIPANLATTNNARYFLAQSSDGLAPPPPLDHDESALTQIGSLPQSQYHDEWRPIGELALQPGWSHIYLSTVTGESAKRLVFDALRLEPV